MASTICVAASAAVDLIESLRIGLREEGAVQQDVLRTSWPSAVAQVVQAADTLSKIHAEAWAYGRADPSLEWGPHAMLRAGMAVARLLGGKRAVTACARKIQSSGLRPLDYIMCTYIRIYIYIYIERERDIREREREKKNNDVCVRDGGLRVAGRLNEEDLVEDARPSGLAAQ